MKFADFQNHFSPPRTARYLTACANDKKRCIQLYKSNLKVAQSFHPLLGILEVALRNGINHELTVYFGDPNWVVNQKTGFMIHPALTFTNKRTGKVETNRFILNSVKSAEHKLGKRGLGMTSGRIISEQTFGFWTDFFENHHYKILRGRPIKMFKHLPSGYGRKEILTELTRIRQFRNRINHNEPVCFVGANVDFSDSAMVYNSIQDILTWINPELIRWAKSLDKVFSTIATAQKV